MAQRLVSYDGDDRPKTPDEQAAADRRQKVAKKLELARKQFNTVVASEAKLRVEQLDDRRFAASDQWPDSAKRDRDLDNRPWMTINRLPQFMRQVTNAQRQANLSVKVSPVEGSDIKTAEVFQGLIRNIEDKSDAAVAYTTAADNQVDIGRGWVRITTEYTHERSFTQELRIKRVRNAFTVYMDPAHQELDGSDARYCFIVNDMPKDEYIAKFGDDAFASLTEFVSTGDMSEDDWMPEGKVRVAEWWYVEEVPVNILAIQWPDMTTPSGQVIRGARDVVTEKEYDEFPDHLKDGGTVTDNDGKTSKVTGVKVIARRKALERRVKVALIDAIKILEGNEDKTEGADWPGRWIPIVPIIGVETDINGVVDYRGMVRDAKDSQRVYNYEVTNLVEVLAQAPLAQWVGYAGQFEGHEAKWLQANRRRFPYLEVNPTTVDGQVAPLPNRIVSEPPIGGIVQAIAQSDNDLKATMGLWDPSLGQRGPQQSGVAITALQKQGEMANSNFLESLSRAIRAVGRILIDLIPHYYDAPRVERIMGNDETEKNVIVHSGADDTQLPTRLPPGIEGIYDLSAGRYDIAVSAGPSIQTRRQEAAQSLTEFVKVFPPAFQALGDLIVANMDWPGSQAASQRLRKMVPPQLLDDSQQPQVPPEVQQKLMEAQQMTQALQMELAEAQRKLDAKMVETEGKARIAEQDRTAEIQVAQLKAQADIEREKMKVQGQLIVAKFEAEMDRLEQRLAQAHERGMAAMGYAAEDERDEKQFGRESVASVRDRQFDREDTERGRQFEREDRGFDREDAERDHERTSEGEERTRQADREDSAVEYARGRREAERTRQQDREDALIGRRLDREDRDEERRETRKDTKAAEDRTDKREIRAGKQRLAEIRAKPKPKKSK